MTGPATVTLAQGSPWETFTIEQPALVRSGATYYLFYSGGYWESRGYAVGYATGPSPRGPFTKQTASRPWLGSSDGTIGPGAFDVFTGPDGTPWASFHAWSGPVGYVNGGKRTLRAGPLSL